MSKQVQVVNNQYDLIKEISDDLLLTEVENIYDVKEVNEGNVIITSGSGAAINSVTFANKNYKYAVHISFRILNTSSPRGK